MEHHLTIRPTGKIGKGIQYEVAFNGEVIAAGVSPEFAACRALADRGLTGTACFWREGKPNYDFRINIAWGVGRCVMENAKMGPRFAKWAPNPLFAKGGEELEEAA
jgi:hypothetical protein